MRIGFKQERRTAFACDIVNEIRKDEWSESNAAGFFYNLTS